MKPYLGIKLCKLLGQFLGRVNNINYGVNYKFLPGHVQDHIHFSAFYTQLFSSKMLPSLPSTSSFMMPGPWSAWISSFEWGHLQGSQQAHLTLLYPPQDNPYGFHGLADGFHGMADGFHGLADGFHGISRSFHGLSKWIHTVFTVESIWNPWNPYGMSSWNGISRWIPYCLSQTSCHLKILYKTHM